jgi:hypothetical protein
VTGAGRAVAHAARLGGILWLLALALLQHCKAKEGEHERLGSCAATRPGGRRPELWQPHGCRASPCYWTVGRWFAPSHRPAPLGARCLTRGPWRPPVENKGLASWLGVSRPALGPGCLAMAYRLQFSAGCQWGLGRAALAAARAEGRLTPAGLAAAFSWLDILGGSGAGCDKTRQQRAGGKTMRPVGEPVQLRLTWLVWSARAHAICCTSESLEHTWQSTQANEGALKQSAQAAEHFRVFISLLPSP